MYSASAARSDAPASLQATEQVQAGPVFLWEHVPFGWQGTTNKLFQGSGSVAAPVYRRSNTKTRLFQFDNNENVPADFSYIFSL